MRGYFTLIVLIVASLFLWYLDTIVISVIQLQHRQMVESNFTQAFASAEAGLEYYRWHLAHFPADLTDGTGHAGPYAHAITDALGNAVGTSTLSIVGDVYCGTTTSVAIISEGTSSNTLYTQTLSARYAKPSIAAKAYVTGSAFDTTATTALFPTLKTYANTAGIYLPPSGSYGYKIVFNPDGSFTAAPVTTVRQIWGNTGSEWKQENSVIASLGPNTTYSIPASCPLVFVEDTAWVEGTVSGRVALVSENASGSGADTNVFLTGNIAYENASGDALTIIGQGNVLAAPTSPDILTLKGVYVAINGMFGRNEYLASGVRAVPSDLAAYVTRSSISVYGTVASHTASRVTWNDASGNFVSGYSNTSYSVDESLAKRPPPFAPNTAPTPRFISWTQNN